MRLFPLQNQQKQIKTPSLLWPLSSSFFFNLFLVLHSIVCMHTCALSTMHDQPHAYIKTKLYPFHIFASLFLFNMQCIAFSNYCFINLLSLACPWGSQTLLDFWDVSILALSVQNFPLSYRNWVNFICINLYVLWHRKQVQRSLSQPFLAQVDSGSCLPIFS